MSAFGAVTLPPSGMADQAPCQEQFVHSFFHLVSILRPPYSVLGTALGSVTP